MKRMCAELLPDDSPCGMVLGWVVCAEQMRGIISHGICECCYERKSDEIGRWREHQAALALACEYTFDLGGAGPRAPGGNPHTPGPAPELAVNGNATKAPARPEVDLSRP
jgi:hypothetical protein